MAKRGDELRLYISDDFEAADSALVLVDRAGDIDVNNKRKSAKYTLRGEDYEYAETLKREFDFKTTYRRKKKGLTDATWDLIATAMANNTPLYCVLLNGPIPAVGSASTGVKGAFLVEDVSEKHPNNDLSEVSLQFTPCIHQEGTDVYKITSKTVAVA